MEFTSRSGAKPYEQRRQEIDEERVARGEMPISDEDFMNIVYDPTEPVVIELQEKIKTVQAQLEDDLESADEGASPRTQSAIQLKNNLTVLAKARSPRKGKVNLFPQDTLAELMGARDATRLLKKRKVQEIHESVEVPDEVYLMMPTILEELKQMVRSLPTREVLQSVLDKEVRNLATASFPHPSQRSKYNNYIRTASVVLIGILKDNDKIIVEETLIGKAVVVGTSNNGDEVGVGGNYEDEDVDAHNYPLL